MRGQGHYYCENCRHAVRAGAWGCRSCSTPLADLVLLDVMLDGGMRAGGIGFDPLDGQVAIDIPGTDLAIEPGTGQVDLDFGGIDIPIF